MLALLIHPKRRFPALVLLALLGWLSGGCASTDQRIAPASSKSLVQANENLNPTAIALHDLAGRLLWHLAQNEGQRPSSLSQLAWPNETSGRFMLDPATQQPWGYWPEGLEIPPYLGRMVVRQSVATEPGYFWVLTIQNGRTASQFAAHVYRVPVSAF